jgi:hypothetical protein
MYVIWQEGMVLTNEPGCYFIESEIEAALADPKKAKHMVIHCGSVLYVRFEGRIPGHLHNGHVLHLSSFQTGLSLFYPSFLSLVLSHTDY